MREPFASFYNEIVGKILRNCRLRANLSIYSVHCLSKESHFLQIIDFEKGKKSPKGYQFYELMKIYNFNMTIDEELFFSIPLRLFTKNLSPQFQKKYFTKEFDRNLYENTFHR